LNLVHPLEMLANCRERAQTANSCH